jgi:hypothetical protein
MARANTEGTECPDVESNAADDGVALPLGRVFELLADQRRRYALYYLKHMTGERVSFETVVEKIAEWEALDGEQDATELRARVAESFRRVHLPRFVDAGIVEYVATAGVLRYTPHTLTEKLLERVGETTY